MARMETDCNLKNLGKTFEVVSSARPQKLDITGLGLFSLCELRLYLPLDVQRYCCSWVNLPTTNFRIVWTKNQRNPRDVAPLNIEGWFEESTFY